MRHSKLALALTIFGIIGLSGCGKAKPGVYEDLMADKAIRAENQSPAKLTPPPPPAVAADAAVAAADAATGVEGTVSGSGGIAPNPQTQPVITTPMLAYEYSMSLRLPLNKVGTQMRADMDLCVKAGPAKCQLINSHSDEGDSISNASLSIRAEPKWLETFKSGLAASAKENGGRILKSSVSSTDLTMEITDTEARIRALSALRSRLEKIIAERPGKLADLLEAEKELARVQGDIDSFNSQLNVAKARVAMSILNIDYSANSAVVSQGVFDPISSAFSDFFYSMMQVFGFLISALAIILPLAIVFVPLGLWIRKLAKKREPEVKQ